MAEDTTHTNTNPNTNSNTTYDWRSEIEDEGLRAQPVFATIKAENSKTAINELAKQLSGAQKMIGADKVVRPLDSWTPDQISSWRKDVLKVPEKSDGYNVDLSDFKGVASDVVTNAMKDLALKSGLAPDQARSVLRGYWQMVKDAEASDAAETVKLVKGWEEQVTKKWGSEYEKNKALLEHYVKNVANPELQKLFEDEPLLLKNPAIMQHFVDYAKALSDDSMKLAGGASGSQTTLAGMDNAAQVRAHISGLETNPAYLKVIAAGGLDNLRRQYMLEKKSGEFSVIESTFKEILNSKTEAYKRLAEFMQQK